MLYAYVLLCIIIPHTSYFHAGPVFFSHIPFPAAPYSCLTHLTPPRYPRILLLHTLHTSVLPRILVLHTSHLRATPAFLSHTHMVYISLEIRSAWGSTFRVSDQYH